MRRQAEFQIHPEFYIFLSVMLLLLPLQWLCAALLAGFLHELGHYLAIKAFRIPVYSISLQGAGAKIKTGEMNPLQAILCASAGPFVGGILFLLFPVMPKLAVCGLLQTLYNLLPFPHYDGGRIMRGILSVLFGEDRAKRILPKISLGLLLAASIALCRFHLLAGLTAMVYILHKFKKQSCIHLTKNAGVLN